MSEIKTRKGYSRRSDIPPAVLRSLNEGREEARTLSEWLVIDVRVLSRALAKQVQLDGDAAKVAARADALAELGVMKRLEGMGLAMHELTHGRADYPRIFEAMATHASDTVRSWAAYMIAADAAIPLKKRLAMTRRFACDRNAGVRETAWFTLRPFVAAKLDASLKLLEPWVRDADENIRRCAVELTRPRGVWCAHLEALKREPELALHLLEPVKSDPSLYVRKSVANWLNDASKSCPQWVREVCARWRRESRTKHTTWITQRGLRTLTKSKSQPAATRGKSSKRVKMK